jgi:hypothetical protein
MEEVERKGPPMTALTRMTGQLPRSRVLKDLPNLHLTLRPPVLTDPLKMLCFDVSVHVFSLPGDFTHPDAAVPPLGPALPSSPELSSPECPDCVDPAEVI